MPAMAVSLRPADFLCVCFHADMGQNVSQHHCLCNTRMYLTYIYQYVQHM